MSPRTSEPLRHVGEIPVYRWGSAPEGLLTRGQLAEQRKKPAEGQGPAAYVTSSSRYMDDAALYDPDATVALRPLNAAAIARRTCQSCGKVGTRVVYGGSCQTCREAEEAARRKEEALICWGCKARRSRPFPKGAAQYCRSCRAGRAAEARQREQEAARRRRSCPDCGKRTATTATIEAWKAEEENRYRSWSPRRCKPCQNTFDTEQRRRAGCCPDCRTRTAEDTELDAWVAEGNSLSGFAARPCSDCTAARLQRAEDERQAARQRRHDEVQALARWAREILDDPAVRILDTETTGLEGDSRIVEIAVLTPGRTVLMDTLVNPGEKIPRQATGIHGIGDGDVASAPAFPELVDELVAALHGHRVVIYNSSYDVSRIRFELSRHLADPEAVQAWLGAVTWEDAMMPYSEFVGEIHEYYGDVRWQKLNGGHRAAGDCHAVIECLEEMVAAADPAAVPS